MNAVPGASGERHGVQVVDHELPAHGRRIFAARVGAQRSGCHLAQFLFARWGASIGRVAVFLDLRRERAAAGSLVVRVQLVDDLVERRLGEAVPFDRRIVGGILVRRQFAVFDEQQAVVITKYTLRTVTTTGSPAGGGGSIWFSQTNSKWLSAGANAANSRWVLGV